MGTQADEIEARIVRLAINQNEIGPDMAVAVIIPLAGKCMVEISPWQRLVLCQNGYRL